MEISAHKMDNSEKMVLLSLKSFCHLTLFSVLCYLCQLKHTCLSAVALSVPLFTLFQ